MSLQLDEDTVTAWLLREPFRPASKPRFDHLQKYMLTTVIPLYNAAVKRMNDRAYRRKYGNPVSVWFRTQMNTIESRFRSLNPHQDTMAELGRLKERLSVKQAIHGMYISDPRKRALFSPSIVWAFLVVAAELLREPDGDAKKLQTMLSTRMARRSKSKLTF